jgi:hypothetical protein
LTSSFSQKTIHVSGHTGKKMALRFGNDRSAAHHDPPKRERVRILFDPMLS